MHIQNNIVTALLNNSFFLKKYNEIDKYTIGNKNSPYFIGISQ